MVEQMLARLEEAKRRFGPVEGTRTAELIEAVAREADQHDSLELPLRWELGETEATRTRARVATGPMFFHGGPLIRRCSLAEEIPELELVRQSRPSFGQQSYDRRDAATPRERGRTRQGHPGCTGKGPSRRRGGG